MIDGSNVITRFFFCKAIKFRQNRKFGKMQTVFDDRINGNNIILIAYNIKYNIFILNLNDKSHVLNDKGNNMTGI